MKNFLRILLLGSIFSLAFGSCKKNKKLLTINPLVGTWKFVYRSGGLKTDGKGYEEGKKVTNGKVEGNGSGGIGGGDSTIITLTFENDGKYRATYLKSNNKNWRIGTAAQDSGTLFSGNYIFRTDDGSYTPRGKEGDMLILGGDGDKTVYRMVGDTGELLYTWKKKLASWEEIIKDKRIWGKAPDVIFINRKTTWKTNGTFDTVSDREQYTDATMATIGYIYVGNIDTDLAKQLTALRLLQMPNDGDTDAYVLGGSGALKQWADKQTEGFRKAGEMPEPGEGEEKRKNVKKILIEALVRLKGTGEKGKTKAEELLAEEVKNGWLELNRQLKEALETGILKEWRENVYKLVIGIKKGRAGGLLVTTPEREMYRVQKVDRNELILTSSNQDYYTFDTSSKRISTGVQLKFTKQ